MSHGNRRYGSGRNSSHYGRGYAYTSGRRDAHWHANVRQRRVRYLRGLICGPAGRSMLAAMTFVAVMLGLMTWQGVIPLSTAVAAFLPAALSTFLVWKLASFLVRVLSYFMFT